MGLRMDIRAALAAGNKDAMQLLAVCPSARSFAQITNNVYQLAREGKILRTAEEREYVLKRQSNRTREHGKLTKFAVWSLGNWPDPCAVPQRPAENMPSWLMRAKNGMAR